MFAANTTVTLLGGTGTNRFGDEVDIDGVKETGVPASILEGSMARRNRPADGRTDQVRSYTLRITPRVDLAKYDRIRDEKTGETYTIDSITRPRNTVGHSTTSAILRRVT